MINIQKLVEQANTAGYRGANAAAKVCRDIVNRLSMTFKDKEYIKNLDSSDKRWIDDEINVIIEGILNFMNKISEIKKEHIIL